MVEPPKGVTCKCGEFTPFHVWVYAHMNIEIEFTCPKCGTKYTVFDGYAEEQDEPTRKTRTRRNKR